ncbi:MAG: hypothetical protein ACRDOG_05800 [Gaiellaceae bacterium]
MYRREGGYGLRFSCGLRSRLRESFRRVATGTGHARNLAVVASCDVRRRGRKWRTLAEVAYARLLGRPVVVLEPGWEIEGEGVERAATPGQAVELALRLAGA